MRSSVVLAALALAATLSTSPMPAQVWEVDNRLLELATGGQYQARYGQTLAGGDFDGDGVADLAVGAPSWNFGENQSVGRVELFRGAASRALPFWAALTWATTDNLFAGAALAAGDFDGDGDDDLAIGQPYRDVLVNGSWRLDAGSVQIASWNGAIWVLGTVWSQQQALGSLPEENDRFGQSLVAADFDDDGDDDLAIGVPYENVAGLDNAGMIQVLYGGPTGLAPGGHYFLPGQDGLLGVPQPADLFGWSLAAGDFDFDGVRDLAVGAPLRDVGNATDAGQVHVLYGSANGLEPAGNQLFDDGDFAGEQTGFDEYFGAALAAGNFDYPGAICAVIAFDSCAADLAIGVPGEDFFFGEPIESAGKFVVVYGTVGGGLTVVGAQSIVQSAGSVPEPYDEYGAQLSAAGGLDGFAAGRQAADLVVASKQQDVGGQLSAGMVDLWFGGPSGIGSYPPQWQAERAGFASSPAQDGDEFGSAIVIADFDDDGWGDLAIGIPGKLHDGFQDSGAVQILYGALFADGFGSGNGNQW